MRIFIAEDDPIILAGFTMMVRELGYEIAGQALDGESAIKQIMDSQPDLILMDVNIPKIDGISVIEQCNREKIIPSIIITGYRDEEQINRAVTAGVYGYLHKPVDEYELRVEISIAMKRHAEYLKLEKELEKAVNNLEERKIIEKAKGIIMDTNGMKEAEAFRFMQKKSRDRNVKLIKLAQEIIDANELFK